MWMARRIGKFMRHCPAGNIASLLILFLTFAQQRAEAGYFIGVDWSGAVNQIDAATGHPTLLGPSGYIRLNSLAKDNSGGLYTAQSQDAITTPRLVRIDPTTGTGSSIPLTGGLTNTRAMAFAPDNTLYAVNSPSSGPEPPKLFKVNVQTGAATLVGTIINSSFPQGLEFGADGTMYLWDINQGLMTLNLNTALATDLSTNSGTGNIQTLAFGPDGYLYGGLSDLYRISPITGAYTLVGAIGPSTTYDIRGLAYIPEPTSLLLLTPGVCFSLGRARRRSLL